MTEAAQPEPLGAVPPDDPRLLGLRQLIWLMDRLRGEGGCPWDREQTHESLRSYLLEESYELLEALEEGEDAAIREELGDVLFQVVFHARIGQEEARFDLGAVAEGIARKLHGRHPHVFDPSQEVEDPAEVARAWQEHKRREGRRSILDGLPRHLPALLRAQRVQAKAATVGFDWPDAAGPLAKLREELGELEAELAAGDPERTRAELGDLLFSAVNLARHLDLDAEDTLRQAAARFESRFRQVEALGGELGELGLAELERRWQLIKAKEGEQEG